MVLAAAALAIAPVPASAALITFTAPTIVSGPFDVVVRAQNLFDGRDPLTDLVISYGFNVAVSNPAVLSFTGATSGPLFDAATTQPGTNVFGAAFGQNGFGIEPGAAEPVTLATLHLETLGAGSSNIVISANLANLFHGLQYLNEPLQEPIAGTVAVQAVPEPATIVMVACGALAAMRRRGATAFRKRRSSAER
jgi:hypothetical protein